MIGNKKVKILAVDSTQHPNLTIGGDVDGPKVKFSDKV